MIGIGIGIGRKRKNWSRYWITRKPSNIVLTVLSATSVKVDWTDAATAADGLKVYFNDVLKATVAFGVGTATISELTAGLLYSVDVVAYKGTNESDAINDSVTISTLLSNLVLSLKWDGSKFINAVTGLEMVNTNSVAAGTPVFTNSATPGVFVTAQSKALSTPDTPDLSMGDIDFMVACFCKITDVTVAQNLVAQNLPTDNQRAWRLAVVSRRFDFAVSSDGGTTNYTNLAGGIIFSNTNYLVLCWHNATANTLNIQVNFGSIYSKAWTKGVFNSSADFTIGEAGGAPAGGKISVDVWKKILSESELVEYWMNGLGAKYPYQHNIAFDFIAPYKIILMGDKSAGDDVAKSTTWNNIAVARNAKAIIGAGDYYGPSNTMAQLLTNLSTLKFSAPGNHDDWIVGVRTEFNINFNNGGYRKISLPYVDFFLYDPYLKTDESGYYTLAQAEAITLAERQASTQGAWLIAQLAINTGKFKVVVFHSPAWASSSDDEIAHGVIAMTAMRWDWSALGANLIINGHFHFYERLLKNTGSGNVPILLLGTAGAADLGWVNIDEESIVRINDAEDAEFNLPGYLVEMTVSADSLQIDLSGIDSEGAVHTGKDQLIIT